MKFNSGLVVKKKKNAWETLAYSLINSMNLELKNKKKAEAKKLKAIFSKEQLFIQKN